MVCAHEYMWELCGTCVEIVVGVGMIVDVGVDGKIMREFIWINVIVFGDLRGFCRMEFTWA